MSEKHTLTFTRKGNDRIWYWCWRDVSWCDTFYDTVNRCVKLPRRRPHKIILEISSQPTGNSEEVKVYSHQWGSSMWRAEISNFREVNLGRRRWADILKWAGFNYTKTSRYSSESRRYYGRYYVTVKYEEAA